MSRPTIEQRAEFVAYLHRLPIRPTTRRNYENWVDRIEVYLDKTTRLSPSAVQSEDDVRRISDRVRRAGFTLGHLKDIRCIIRYYLKFVIGHGVDLEQVQQNQVGTYDPKDPVQGRQRIQRSIALRRGQIAFRDALLRLYQGACCVTGTKGDQVLEAAHIRSYARRGTNELSNGLLLRSDIHVLFDLRLLSIHPKTWKVHVAKSMRAFAPYKALHGVKLAVPKGNDKPNVKALGEHYAETIG